MTRKIIEKNNIHINTYWNGNEEGVQITFNKEYRQMTREEAIKFFEIVIKKLKNKEKMINKILLGGKNKTYRYIG